MKIKNISEPQKFFELLKDCKGKVELVTSEGDKMCIRDRPRPARHILRRFWHTTEERPVV